MYSVYQHTSKTTGKVYIGFTSKPVEARWGNGHNYKHCKAFYQDIIKYGWNDFDHVVLSVFSTYEEANDEETRLIALNRDNCYNVSKSSKTYGCDSTFSKDDAHSNNTKTTCAQRYEHKAPCIKGHGIATIPIVHKPSNRHSCPISQYNRCGELLQVYKSGKEASEATGVNQGDIISCCKGGRTTNKAQHQAGGYIWRYNIDYLDKFPETLGARKRVVKMFPNGSIICTYQSMGEAALSNDLTYCAIQYALSKHHEKVLPDGSILKLEKEGE